MYYRPMSALNTCVVVNLINIYLFFSFFNLHVWQKCFLITFAIYLMLALNHSNLPPMIFTPFSDCHQCFHYDEHVTCLLYINSMCSVLSTLNGSLYDCKYLIKIHRFICHICIVTLTYALFQIEHNPQIRICDLESGNYFICIIVACTNLNE